MKTINFELSKRLNDLGLLKNIETKFVTDLRNIYYNNEVRFIDTENPKSAMYGKGKPYWGLKHIMGHKQEGRIYKTLTLEEAIEFLPKYIGLDCLYIKAQGSGRVIKYYNDYSEDNRILCKVAGFTLLEAIEKIIEYLLDNNLLTK